MTSAFHGENRYVYDGKSVTKLFQCLQHNVKLDVFILINAVRSASRNHHLYYQDVGQNQCKSYALAFMWMDGQQHHDFCELVKGTIF